MKYRCVTLACIAIISVGLMVCLLSAMHVHAQSNDPVSDDDHAEATHQIFIVVDNSLGIASAGSEFNYLPEIVANFAKYLIQYARAFHYETVEIGVIIFAQENTVIEQLRAVDKWDDKAIARITPILCKEEADPSNPCYGTSTEDALTEAANAMSTCRRQLTNCTILLFSDNLNDRPEEHPVDSRTVVRRKLGDLTPQLYVLPIVYGTTTFDGNPYNLEPWERWSEEGVVDRPLPLSLNAIQQIDLNFYKNVLQQLDLLETKAGSIEILDLNQSETKTITLSNLAPDVTSIFLHVPSSPEGVIATDFQPEIDSGHFTGEYEWRLQPDSAMSTVSFILRGSGTVAYGLRYESTPVVGQLTVESSSQFVNEPISLTATLNISGHAIPKEWFDNVYVQIEGDEDKLYMASLQYDDPSLRWNAPVSLTHAGVYTMYLRPQTNEQWQPDFEPMTPVTVTIHNRWDSRMQMEPSPGVAGAPVTVTLAITQNGSQAELSSGLHPYAIFTREDVMGTEPISVTLTQQSTFTWSAVITMAEPGSYRVYSVFPSQSELVTATAAGELAIVAVSATPTPTTTNTPRPTHTLTSVPTPVPTPIITTTPTLMLNIQPGVETILIGVEAEDPFGVHRNATLYLHEIGGNERRLILTHTLPIENFNKISVTRRLWDDVRVEAMVVFDGDFTAKDHVVRAWLRIRWLLFGSTAFIVMTMAMILWGHNKEKKRLVDRTSKLQCNITEQEERFNSEIDESGKKLAIKDKELATLRQESTTKDQELQNTNRDLENYKKLFVKLEKQVLDDCVDKFDVLKRTLDDIKWRSFASPSLSEEDNRMSQLSTQLFNELKECEVSEFSDNIYFKNLTKLALDGEELALHILIKGLVQGNSDPRNAVLVLYEPSVMNLILTFPKKISSIATLMPQDKTTQLWTALSTLIMRIENIESLSLPDIVKSGVTDLKASLEGICEEFLKMEDSEEPSELNSLLLLYGELHSFLRQARRGGKLHFANLEIKNLPDICKFTAEVFCELEGKTAHELWDTHIRRDRRADDPISSLLGSEKSLPRCIEGRIAQLIIRRIWLPEE